MQRTIMVHLLTNKRPDRVDTVARNRGVARLPSLSSDAVRPPNGDRRIAGGNPNTKPHPNEVAQVKKPVETDPPTAAAAAFQLEDFLPYRLAVAADSVSRLIARQHLSKSGLGMSEWRLLAAVGRFGVLSPTAAGEHTAMDKVKVSRAAASLVASGLLRQTQDPEDGRGRLLRLTRKGAALYADVAPTASEIQEALMAGLGRTEWRSLHRALGKLSEHAQSLLDMPEEGEA
jgi:DNA-binding MarR family transcriptional regulator